MIRYWGLGAAALGMIAALFLGSGGISSRDRPEPAPIAAPAESPRAVEEASRAVAEAPRAVKVTLARGDTIASLLARFRLDSGRAHELIKTLEGFFNPRRVRAGQTITVHLHPETEEVQGFSYPMDEVVVQATLADDGWNVEETPIPFVSRTRAARGAVVHSLYTSGTAAGLSPGQIMNLAQIFEYSIDFFSDLRRGDPYAVLFTEREDANGRRRQGRILAARIAAGGTPFKAFYYEKSAGEGGYYDQEGKSLQRFFLRAPLNYQRISSAYSLNRLHPILRIPRPHRAIDYVAPAGTPVVAVGRGRVTFAGWRGGYGNLVEIAHPNGYATRYAHFSRFARGLRAGQTVPQGQVVGYVGQTGHATGPHLHFEILKQGQKINFLQLKTPPVERLDGPDLATFRSARDEFLNFLRDEPPGGDA